MDTNLVITLGSLVAVLSIPSALRNWADGRGFILPLLALMIGVGATGWALYSDPDGIGLGDIPGAVIEVVSRFL